jgi:hypothetical protein
LNIGRIPLTDAELVKALLLSHGQPGPGHTDRGLEIAAHWDLIERDLRVPEVWSFVTGEVKEKPTHISLLLDTLAGAPRGSDRPIFYTFESLRSRIEAEPLEFWREVVNLHSLVLGWYDDRTLFHKVGYLIAVGRTFDELFELSRDKGRSAFEAALDDQIRASTTPPTSRTSRSPATRTNHDGYRWHEAAPPSAASLPASSSQHHRWTPTPSPSPRSARKSV